MTRLASKDDLQTNMDDALKAALKASSGGRFLFLFKCREMDDAPVLVVSDPGKPVDKSFEKELIPGSRPVRGRYQADEQNRLVFYPREEVNGKRMEKLICKISKISKSGLKSSQIKVVTPGDVLEAEGLKEQGKEKIIEGLNSRKTKNKSAALHMTEAVTGLADGVTSLLSTIGKEKPQTVARKKLKEMVEKGSQINDLTVEPLPTPEDLKDLDPDDKTPVGDAKREALKAFEDAQKARVELEKNRRAREQLVLAVDAGMLEGKLSEETASRVHKMISGYANAIAIAELTIEKADHKRTLLQRAQDNALVEEWPEDERRELEILGKETSRKQEGLEQVEGLERKNRLEMKELSQRRSSLLQERKAAWKATEEAEEALEKAQESTKKTMDRIRSDLEKYQQAIEQLSKAIESTPSESKDAKKLKEKLDHAKEDLKDAQKTQRLMEGGFEKLREAIRDAERAAEEAEQKLDSLGDEREELQELALVLEEGRLESRLDLGKSKEKGAQKRIEGYEEQREKEIELLRVQVYGRGEFDADAMEKAEQQANKIREQAKKATAELRAVLEKRESLQTRIYVHQKWKQEKSTSTEKQKEHAAELGKLREEALKLEPELGKTRKEAVALGRQLTEQESIIGHQRQKLLEAVRDDDNLKPLQERLSRLQDALARAREDLAQAEKARISDQESLEEVQKERKIQESMAGALSFLEENIQLSAFDGIDNLKEIVEKAKELDKGTRKENEGKDEDDKALTTQQIVSQLMGKLEDMRELGATPDQLSKVWNKLPTALIPDKYVKELENWRLMEEQLKQELSAYNDSKKGRSGGEKLTSSLKDGVDKASSRFSELADKIDTGVSMIGKLNDLNLKLSKTASVLVSPIPDDLMGPIAKVVSLSNTIAQVAKNTGNLFQKGMKTQGGEPDPIEQLILMEDLIQALQDLLKSALSLGMSAADLAGSLVPFLGAAVSGIESAEQLFAALKRSASMVDDLVLRDKAKKLESSLTGALEQSAGNEGAKALEALGKGLGKGLQAAGALTSDIGTLTAAADDGATKAAGTAVNVTGMVVYLGTEVVVTIKDWSLGIIAWDMVKRAKAGDRHAQQDIFKCSGKYAKGLLALMAKRKDPVALAYIKSRGLTPKMIDQSSPEIIRLYLLRRSGEEDFSFDPGLVEKLQGAWKAAKTAIDDLQKAIEEQAKKADKMKWEEFAKDKLACDVDAIGEKAGELSGYQDALDRVDSAAHPEEYQEMKRIVGDWEKELRGARKTLYKALTLLQQKLQVVSSQQIGLREQLEQASGEKEADQELVKKLTENLRQVTGFLDAVQRHVDARWGALDILAGVV